MQTQAQKEAQRRYAKKIIQKQIKYYPSEVQDFQRIQEHCDKLNITYQQYIKNLAKEDMKRWT